MIHNKAKIRDIMVKKLRRQIELSTIVLFIMLSIQSLYGQDSLKVDRERPLVYMFTLSEDIMPSAWRTVKHAVEEAEALDADYILMKLDTYGGMVNIADSISSKLIKTKLTTLVYIMNNAASAGALISISCDSIYMSPYAKIGAASVVNQQGELVPDKYQSYMRAFMRTAADKSGRDPKIAEAMVDGDVYIPGVVDSGKVLTFTTKEALLNDYCEGEAESAEEALENAGLTDYDLVVYNPSTTDRIISFLLNPMLTGILLTVMFFGIYFELQTPGVGFPLIAAIIAATLYFAPHYLEGLAENWEILIFLLGLILIVLELFVIPGFGIAGIAGALLILVSLVLSMVGNVGFDFRFTGYAEFSKAIFAVIGAIVFSSLLIYLTMRNMASHGLMSRLVLDKEQVSEDGYTIDIYKNKSEFIGKIALAVSDLRPAGKVELNGERYDASAEGVFINKGMKVEIVSTENSYLLVREVPDEIT